jgi:adenosylcobinamide kinase / adenosylcobinamide-phosphate guanylyltransferase
MGQLTLIGGGIRSGKSRYALRLAEERGQRRVFIATAQASDPEMQARIERHRLERAQRYRTIEAPIELAQAIRSSESAEVILVDCLTVWLSNLLVSEPPDDVILACVDELIDAAASTRANVILVTNEVGLGMVALSEVGRRFQDINGWAHQRLSRAAGEIYLAALGCILRLRPTPLAVVE